MAEENKPVEGDEQAPAGDREPQGKFVGGTVTIVADAVTGSIQVSGPRNVLVTLGIIEGAKVVLAMQMTDAMRAGAANRPPTIVKANADSLANLKKFARG